jgi:predicted ATPase
MLLKSGLIDERSLLILDEPEVHLHPKWQIKYAELIIELVKNNITILVTSHSPYMIEALQKYSEMANLTEKTNIYLSENNIIEDKNKLQEIYEKLSEPFDEFEKMDSDILNGK